MTTCPHPEKPRLSKREAHRLLRWLQGHDLDGPGRMVAYQCTTLTHWHIGHVARKMRGVVA